MSSNNLYLQLIDLAAQENITFQQSETQRGTQTEIISPFSNKIQQIKQKIGKIRNNNEKILRLKDKLAYNALPTSESQLYEQTRLLCDQNYELILQLRTCLQQLTDIVKKNAEVMPDQPQTHSQMYQKQYMVREVNKMINQTQNIQLLIQKFSINTSLKRIKALAPELNDEQAQEIARKKNGFDQLIMSKTMGKASLKLKYRVEDIVQKNKQIAKLQQIIEQNLKLMQQIAYMVKQQGQMIDNIQQNVLNAKDYIEKAEVNLKKEKKQHKRSRKKLCCIIFIGIVVLALIITPIVLTIVNQNKKAANTTV